MEIRDVIHGAILVERHELPIVDSPYFQRLRHIKQLGFAEYSFPSATHNRYIHSLGALETATQAIESIFDKLGVSETRPELLTRYRTLVRLGALLHDIGHGPLSHTTEFAMPLAHRLQIPEIRVGTKRQATHEDYTLKMILDSGLTPLIDRVGLSYGFTSRHVAALICDEIEIADDFFEDRLDGQKVNFRPLLQQLISSELDADRMDYLRRDSHYCGVSYGQFDYSWLLANLTAHVKDGKCYLALQHRALYSFEDFLLSRFHMFLMVYFHYKSVVFDEMLAQYLHSPECSYSLPSDIESYLHCTDSQLHAHLAGSPHPWAQRIHHKKPYRLLVELHSGVPATKTATLEQRKLLNSLHTKLRGRKTHFLEVTSSGELSKYFQKPADPIFVRYDNHYSAPTTIPLHQCTDLFTKYSEKRSITRLYVSPEDYAACRYEGRHLPLKFADSEFAFEAH